MKKYVVILGALCLSSGAIAENQGVESTSYSLFASASESNSGNRMSFSAGARFPIANYTGASVLGRYSNFNGKNNYFDSSTNSASLGVFVRKYDLGIINAGYGYSRSESDLTVNNNFVAYNKFTEKPMTSKNSYVEKEESREVYSCEGKKYCSEMTSCEEAKFYQRNCPDTKMDGDGDGIPCERQWCGW